MPDFDTEVVTPPSGPVRDRGRFQRFTVFMDPKGTSIDHIELIYDLYNSDDSDLESEQVVLRRFSDARTALQPMTAALKALVKAWMVAGTDEDRPS